MAADDKLRAAVERIREWFAKRYDPGFFLRNPGLEQDILDLIAEHHADDGQPVDAAWADLVSPGGLVPGSLRLLPIEVRPWALRVNGETVVENPTRGHVRRLLAALGVPLAETPHVQP